MTAARKNRLTVLLSDDELNKVSEYRWNKRVPSQVEAARQLIEKGLENEKAEAAVSAATPA